jgi:hypothetical protein
MLKIWRCFLKLVHLFHRYRLPSRPGSEFRRSTIPNYGGRKSPFKSTGEFLVDNWKWPSQNLLICQFLSNYYRTDPIYATNCYISLLHKYSRVPKENFNLSLFQRWWSRKSPFKSMGEIRALANRTCAESTHTAREVANVNRDHILYFFFWERKVSSKDDMWKKGSQVPPCRE